MPIHMRVADGAEPGPLSQVGRFNQYNQPLPPTYQGERPMIETNSNASELSPVEKGREFLEKGDIPSAIKLYGQAFDPEALDESEARNMLIEARAQLSRKHLFEALESFEEALLMGTDVQRRQALDGIIAVGELRAKVPRLTAKLKKGFKDRLGKNTPTGLGLALVSDQENVVLISREALVRLPPNLGKSSRIRRIPQHLSDYQAPFKADHCISYADEDDVDYVLEVLDSLLTSNPPVESD